MPERNRGVASGGAISDSDFRSAANELLSWKRPLLISHQRPDGDALGCLLAARSMLLALGSQPTAMVFEPPPARYAFMAGFDRLHVLSGQDDPVLTGCDGVLIMDTCAAAQLAPVVDWLRGAAIPKIALDHHSTRDDLADRYLVDAGAAAACLLLYRWARCLDWRIPFDAAEALFIGVATDTGWFRFSNTTSEVLRTAADLADRGLDMHALYERIHWSDPPSRLRLRSAALSQTDLRMGDRVAIIPVSQDMLASAGASVADTEEIVSIPLSVGSVEVSVLLVDTGGGLVKASFRSKSAFDVARLAAGFGGGGHARAAGARISGSLESVMNEILQRIEQMRS